MLTADLHLAGIAVSDQGALTGLSGLPSVQRYFRQCQDTELRQFKASFVPTCVSRPSVRIDAVR